MNKYHAISTQLDGFAFASKAEARRYAELRLLERAGEIVSLVPHPRYDLRADNGAIIGRYTADFEYVSTRSGEVIVEDVKGGRATRTEAYRLRKRLFEANYGIQVTEIG